MVKKVIVDTDTGIDDAMGCVLALLRPELDVLGLTLVSLDVTDNTLFRAADLQRLNKATSPAASSLQRIIPFYMEFYTPLLGEHACAMHSALTVGVVANPSLITASESLPIQIELKGETTRGMTVADRRPGRKVSANREWMACPESTLITDVDRSAFVEYFLPSVGV